MPALCFVCSLPILSHQVGLVWKGGSGADEYAASQPIPARRRDSTAQLAAVEPPSPPGRPRRRRSSLAQLTDLIRDWGRGGGERRRAELGRRDTLSDLARSLPFGRRDSDSREPREAPRPRAGRRQSLAEGHLKSKRRGEAGSDLRADISSLLAGRESVTELWRKRRETQVQSQRQERRARRQSVSSTPSGRDAKPAVSPDGKYIEPRALIELRRQAAAFDESSPLARGRSGSRPFLSPDPFELEAPLRSRRRDSLSPDSGRRQSSEEPTGRGRHGSHHGLHRSPDGSSTGSSRDPSPNSSFRRQSTTEEILIAKGFRRQSTTEDMVRCRNFRRQSTVFEDVASAHGGPDPTSQLLDGTVPGSGRDTGSTFYPAPTASEDASPHDNNYYHEECLRCNSCGQNLTGPNQKRARRHDNTIYCDLHFADLALMESSDFMNQLRAFKPQSLGCAVARRKSSTTLIFPLPPQACSDEFCRGYPHNLIVTPGYWVECAGQPVEDDVAWDADEDPDDHQEDGEEEDAQNGTAHREDAAASAEDEEAPFSPGERRLLRVPTIRAPTRDKTPIEEHYEKCGAFELTSIEQETYEKYFYGTEHWNYFTQDEDLGPIILSLKQENINGRDQFRARAPGTFTPESLSDSSR
ncbi:uncharacterized protein LOC119101580 [Pollicipes pollicipes]|uniref:uncharacterized protein LOC119101580 n=1 Tax=Pollicipes pollicipes TaxID=41117 RepID=UPI0018855C3B|nr:uncharacterized protein LOC119101580 [Pollicipes pollicipes]